ATRVGGGGGRGAGGRARAGGATTGAHAGALRACRAATRQQELLELILARGLTVRQAERAATAPTAAEAPAAAARSADLAALEEEFRRALGTKVALKRAQGGRAGHGTLVIYYFSDEELDGLYRAICHPERE